MAEAKETQNILKQIYSSSASLAKASEENSTTLQSIYKLQLESEKRRKATQKKADRDARRKLRDDKRDDLDAERKEKKEKKEAEGVSKNLFEKIKEGLSGLLGGIGPILTGALAGLAPAITSALSGVGNLLTGLVKGLGGGLKSAFGPISSALGKIAPSLAPALGAIAGIGLAVVGLAAGAGKVVEMGRRAYYGGGEAGELGQKIYESTLETKAANRNRRNRQVREYTAEEKDRLAKAEQYEKELLKIKKEREILIKKRTEEIRNITKNIRPNRSGAKRLNAEQQQAVTLIQQKYGQLEAGLDKRVSALVESAGTTFDKRKPVKRQNGGKIPGAFTVPGSGDGDQFPIDLPAGSFVLNRNASDTLRQGLQRGGQTQMVPTLLEPGERVFLPGQWENSGIEQLNKTVSRFQTGGVVQGDHPDTGPGWNVGADQQGRPSIFTHEAATALSRAIKDSQGAVKTSDITSSRRSPAKNKAVGGVSNSNHLTGNAVDIHGTSKAWLKANGMNYGWKNLVYGGHDGHFDFIKGSSPINEGTSERTADQDNSQVGGQKIDQQAIEGVSEDTSPLSSTISQLSSGESEVAKGLALFAAEISNMFASLVGAGVSGKKEEGASGATGGGTSLSLGGSQPGGEFGESALISAMDKAGMTNKLERASFLAQMAHESDNFRASEEYASGEKYEGRTDLGNTQPGDGVRYKGRGYIQITGRYNYKKFGDIVGHDLVNNPELASDPNIAAQVALAYWKDRGISGPAQKGDNKQVTYLINGGYNGLEDRQEKFAKYKQQGLQTGGLVNMKGATNKLDERMQTAQTKVNEKEAKEAAAGPIVITKPSGGGGSNGVSIGVSPAQPPPVLPETCSATLAADYTYNLSLGGY